MEAAQVAHGFLSLLRDLLPGDPYVPPKPWESVSSESGAGAGDAVDAGNAISSAAGKPLPCYDPASVSETELVRLVLNALQGVKYAVDAIEKLSSLFLLIPSDRTFHGIPSVWRRSLSTNALGRILQSVGQSGAAVCFLRNFVDYFINPNSAKVGGTVGEANTGRPLESLVNQAFAVAVRKILEEYICALNVLYASAKLRRSAKSVDSFVDGSFRNGCLTSIVHSDITVLEVHLHTKELMAHIESLANICLFGSQELNSSSVALVHRISFHSYIIPSGADLLTYLYVLLRDSDPVHRPLLEFLFVQSCEPYCGFIKSWIYRANVNDPYQEFVMKYLEDSVPWMHLKNKKNFHPQFEILKEQAIAVPCFLEDVRKPLLHTGLQLQVLIKMLNICKWNINNTSDCINSFSSPLESEEVLPYMCDYLSWDKPCSSAFLFGREAINTMILKRKKAFSMLWKKLEMFFSRMDFACDRNSSNVILSSTVDEQYLSDGDLEYSHKDPDKKTNTLDSEFKVIDVSTASESFTFDAEDVHSSECSSLRSFDDSSDSEGFVDSSVLGTASELLQNLMIKPQVEALRSDPVEMNLLRDLHKSSPSQLLVNTESRFCALLDKHFTGIDEAVTSQSLSHLDADDDDLSGKRNVIDESLFNENAFASSMGEFMPFTDKSKFNEWNFDGKNGKFVEFLNDSQRCCHLLNVNPMLTKKARFSLTTSSVDKGFTDYRQSMFPYFDFSSVQDPCKAYGDNFKGCSYDELLADAYVPSTEEDGALLAKQQKKELVSLVNGLNDMLLQEKIRERDNVYSNHSLKEHAISCSPVLGGVNVHLANKHGIESNLVVNDSSNLVPASKSLTKDCCLDSTSNGSSWAKLLLRSSKDDQLGAPEKMVFQLDEFEAPLDIVIDQCIVQEILLQYDYISRFTVKMLEKGFDLQGHLSALKRYYFMELADWADSFILSLWHQRSNIAKFNHWLPEIRGLLDSALQKSSCKSDHFKERLFVCLEGVGDSLGSSSAFGVCAFNFISLGYRVDWPVNIILSPNALKVYSKIFNFLTQIKLAVISLNHIWCMLKDMKHPDSCLTEQEIKCFNFITIMRQQLNYFVCTLQQYVQSQLSHVSWCNFIQSLRNQVIDILDLESLHMSYLADALLICFLSSEAQHAADIILCILQCALDFEACCSDVIREAKLDRECSILPPTLVEKVSVIKGSFEMKLKDLYVCYLKTPKHRQFGLHQFWEYLNYNDYFSNFIVLAACRRVV